MKKQYTTLICTRVKFHALKDEDAFFEWIKKIRCIESFDGAGRQLYLKIINNSVDDRNLDELIGLFYRYNINMKQLRQFLTKKNKEWFFDNKIAFWHKHVFGKTKPTPSKDIILICADINFHSPNDENTFFSWILHLDSLKSFYGPNKKISLHIKNNVINDADLKELIGLFSRYKIDMKQLQQFLTPRNKVWLLQDERIFDKNKPSLSKGEK